MKKEIETKIWIDEGIDVVGGKKFTAYNFNPEGFSDYYGAAMLKKIIPEETAAITKSDFRWLSALAQKAAKDEGHMGNLWSLNKKLFGEKI